MNDAWMHKEVWSQQDIAAWLKVPLGVVETKVITRYGFPKPKKTDGELGWKAKAICQFFQRSTETQLYRHFDADGALLYVGVSLSAVARHVSHERFSAWFPQVKTITVEVFPTRDKALAAETRAIRKEKPRFNVAGAPKA